MCQRSAHPQCDCRVRHAACKTIQIILCQKRIHFHFEILNFVAREISAASETHILLPRTWKTFKIEDNQIRPRAMQEEMVNDERWAKEYIIYLCIQALSSSGKWPQMELVESSMCWQSIWQIENPSSLWRITENYHVRCSGIDFRHRHPCGSFLSSDATRAWFPWILNGRKTFLYVFIVRHRRHAKASSTGSRVLPKRKLDVT